MTSVGIGLSLETPTPNPVPGAGNVISGRFLRVYALKKRPKQIGEMGLQTNSAKDLYKAVVDKYVFS